MTLEDPSAGKTPLEDAVVERLQHNTDWPKEVPWSRVLPQIFRLGVALGVIDDIGARVARRLKGSPTELVTGVEARNQRRIPQREIGQPSGLLK